LSFIQESFDRTAKVRVFKQTITDKPTGGSVVSSRSPKGLEFASKNEDGSPGYRIKFTVEKVKEATPNPTTILIYNLGPEGRSGLGRNYLLELEVGYGKNTGIIFKGNISYVKTKKEGPDFVTQIDAADGIFATQNSKVDISFKETVKATQAITTLGGLLAPQGVMIGKIDTGSSKDFQKGLVLSGNTMVRLKEICDKNDLECTIQNQELVVIPKGTAKLSPILLISSGAFGLPNTGLIGIPEIRQTGSEKEPSVISFKTLMNFNLEIFQKILLNSRFIPTGTYTILKITHNGDTWSGDWTTDCEASGQGIVI